MDSAPSIDKETWDALRAGFNLTEMEVWEIGKKGVESIKDPLLKSHPEAFTDGLDLKKAALFVFSADTQREYEEDTESYDRIATRLNAKYGRVAYLNDESTALGLIGERYSPWANLTTVADGVTTVTHPRAEVEAEDEIIRRELGWN